MVIANSSQWSSLAVTTSCQGHQGWILVVPCVVTVLPWIVTVTWHLQCHQPGSLVVLFVICSSLLSTHTTFNFSGHQWKTFNKVIRVIKVSSPRAIRVIKMSSPRVISHQCGYKVIRWLRKLFCCHLSSVCLSKNFYLVSYMSCWCRSADMLFHQNIVRMYTMLTYKNFWKSVACWNFPPM